MTTPDDARAAVECLRVFAALGEGAADMLDAEDARALLAHIATKETEIAALHGEASDVATAIGSVRWMDPPDGGSVTLAEQVRRMREDLEAAEARAERAERAVRTVQNAAKTLDASRQAVIGHYTREHQTDHVARATLDSEREANAILTERAEAAERRADTLAAQVAGLREALDGIRQYGSDTLSGRADGPTDIEWFREGIREMMHRAAVACSSEALAAPAPESRVAELEGLLRDLRPLTYDGPKVRMESPDLRARIDAALEMGTKNNPGKFDCYANAEPDEPMFVLLGRDRHAPILVALWAEMRASEGELASKIFEAQDCANAMLAWLGDQGKTPADIADAMEGAARRLRRLVRAAKQEPRHD